MVDENIMKKVHQCYHIHESYLSCTYDYDCLHIGNQVIFCDCYIDIEDT
jgi:hypothetical protein